jgi:hypothetical protein
MVSKAMTKVRQRARGEPGWRSRACLAVLLGLAPGVARAHGGGFELVLPAWLFASWFFLWAYSRWEERSAIKLATTGAVALAAVLGFPLASRLTDSTAPLDVAGSFIFWTVIAPLVLFGIVRFLTARPKAPPNA